MNRNQMKFFLLENNNNKNLTWEADSPIEHAKRIQHPEKNTTHLYPGSYLFPASKNTEALYNYICLHWVVTCSTKFPVKINLAYKK